MRLMLIVLWDAWAEKVERKISGERILDTYLAKSWLFAQSTDYMYIWGLAYFCDTVFKLYCTLMKNRF